MAVISKVQVPLNFLLWQKPGNNFLVVGTNTEHDSTLVYITRLWLYLRSFLWMACCWVPSASAPSSSLTRTLIFHQLFRNGWDSKASSGFSRMEWGLGNHGQQKWRMEHVIFWFTPALHLSVWWAETFIHWSPQKGLDRLDHSQRVRWSEWVWPSLHFLL